MADDVYRLYQGVLVELPTVLDNLDHVREDGGEHLGLKGIAIDIDALSPQGHLCLEPLLDGSEKTIVYTNETRDINMLWNRQSDLCWFQGSPFPFNALSGFALVLPVTDYHDGRQSAGA